MFPFIRPCAAFLLASALAAGASAQLPPFNHSVPLLPDPILRQETLGTGVTEITGSRLDLAVRNTVEMDEGDLDGDGDADVVCALFYLFQPPLPGQTLIRPVSGSGGIRILINQTRGADLNNPGMTQSPGEVPPPPMPATPNRFYEYAKGALTDETAARVHWTPGNPGGTPPSSQDAKAADVDLDGDLDIVIAAGVGGDPAQVDPIWSTASENIAQDRILINDGQGVLSDQTFGSDGVPMGAQDRLPLRATNTSSVVVGDLDGDGWPDLVFGEYGPDYDGDVNQYLRNTTGGFFVTPNNPFVASKPIGGATWDVELFDLNHNGLLDLVVGNANPERVSVFYPSGLPDPDQLSRRREEVWNNLTQPGGNLRMVLLSTTRVPDPGLPSSSLPPPYDDPGFWSDTRCVAVQDIDNDGDGDILFANVGWEEDAFNERTNEVHGAWAGPTHELRAQAPQLLLNLGGSQAGAVPGKGMNDFLDVTEKALPWGSLAAAPVAALGYPRIQDDFEFTPTQAWTDLGSLADLLSPPGTVIGGAFVKPTRDNFRDLVAAGGPSSRPGLWINSGDWTVFADSTAAAGYSTRGRFFRGDVALDPNWAAAPSYAPALPYSKWQHDQQPSFTPDGSWPRFAFYDTVAMYGNDMDFVDLDQDTANADAHGPWLDIISADGDEERGENNALFLYRGLGRGFRWLGPSDEGAMMPYQRATLAYAVIADDVDGDQDLDILEAGVPTGLALENLSNLGSPGYFREKTFRDQTPGGWFPFTGKQSLYAPLLVESVVTFDADGTFPLEFMIGGYPPNSDSGSAYAEAVNEAKHWHLDDPGYHDPVDDPPGTVGAPSPIHSNYYVGEVNGVPFSDRTLKTDTTGKKWLDLDGRVNDGIADEMRAGDIDGDGDQDVVSSYRQLSSALFATGPPPAKPYNPAQHQIVLSLWMNDAGHLRDEAVARVGPDWATTNSSDHAMWDLLEESFFEGMTLADVDSDGDLDIFLTAVPSGTTSSAQVRNRLLLNMGGDQRSLPAAPASPPPNALQPGWRTGLFRVADLSPAFAGVTWGAFAGNCGGSSAGDDCDSIEAGDFDGDDNMDFVLVGRQDDSGTCAAVRRELVLLNPGGKGVFTGREMPNDPFLDHPGTFDLCRTVDCGDYDADGDLDLVFPGALGDVGRYVENKLGDANGDGRVDIKDGNLTFEDRTAQGVPIGWGAALPDAMTWVPGWAVDAASADFDGDGVHDLYIANHDRAAQDELFLSQATPPPGPRITRVEPVFGAATGQVIRIRGIGFGNSNKLVRFEKLVGGAAGNYVGVTALGTPHPGGLWMTVTVPAGAPLGVLRVYVGTAANPRASNQYTFTHLNAAPAVNAPPVGGQVSFVLTDPDGIGTQADFDLANRLAIQSSGPAGTQSWNGSTYSSGWTLTQNDVTQWTFTRAATSGQTYTLEIGDFKAAYGQASVTAP